MMEIGEIEKKKSMDLLEEWIKMIENPLIANSLISHINKHTITALIILLWMWEFLLLNYYYVKMNMHNKTEIQ